MKKKYYKNTLFTSKVGIYLFLIFSSITFAQFGKVSGSIKDRSSNQILKSATFVISEIGGIAHTFDDGKFLFENLHYGTYTLSISYVGYKSSKEIIVVSSIPTEYTFYLEPSIFDYGEVVISSLRNGFMLKDIPLPLEVIPLRKIEMSPAITVADLMKTQTGVSLSRDGSWETDLVVRGMTGQSVIIMTDGFRVETATEHNARLDLFDINNIERIEIIKGAASSLYGTGGIGGVVNIISKSGFFGDKFAVTAKYTGSYQSMNNASANNLSIRLGDKLWYLKLSGTYREASDTRTPDGMLTNSRYHDNSLYVDFGVRIAHDQTMKINMQNFGGNDIGIPGASAFPQASIARYNNIRRSLFSVDYTISDISTVFKNITVKGYHQYILREVDIIPVAGSNVLLTPNARHSTNGMNVTSRFVFSQSNLLLAGIDIWKREIDSKRERTTISKNKDTIIVIGELPLPVASFLSTGVFVQDEQSFFNGDIKITAGGRFDGITVKNDKVMNPDYKLINGVSVSPLPQTLLWNSTDKTDYSWSANIGVLYILSPVISFVTNIARSFRSPSPEERFQFIDLGNAGVKLGNPDLKPEQGIFFDAGLRFSHGIINMSLEGFYNNLTDLVTDVAGVAPDGRSALIKSNIGSANIYGYELKFEANTYRKAILFGNLSYVRGENIQLGKNLPFIPPINGSFGVKSSISEFFELEVSASFYSEQGNTAPFEIAPSGYIYYNLYLNTSSFKVFNTAFKIFTGVENLSDVSYRNFLSTNRGVIKTEPGRNVFVKLMAEI